MFVPFLLLIRWFLFCAIVIIESEKNNCHASFIILFMVILYWWVLRSVGNTNSQYIYNSRETTHATMYMYELEELSQLSATVAE